MSNDLSRHGWKLLSMTLAVVLVVAVVSAFQTEAADVENRRPRDPFEGETLTCTTEDGGTFHMRNARFTSVMGRSSLRGERIGRIGNGFVESADTIYLPWETVTSVIVHDEVDIAAR